MTKPSDWEAAIEFTRARFGAIDVLVNNAGIVRAATIEEMSYDDYLLVVSVNQHGCWLGIKHVIPAMRASGGGSIVNVSSQAGITPSVSISAYTASKFAIRGITRVAAAELGHDGIRVNAVLPGAVDTEMTASHTYSPERRRAAYAQQPVARIAEPVEIAKLVLFLASDDSSYCTGSDFLIDGGTLATLQVPRPEPV